MKPLSPADGLSAKYTLFGLKLEQALDLHLETNGTYVHLYEYIYTSTLVAILVEVSSTGQRHPEG